MPQLYASPELLGEQRIARAPHPQRLKATTRDRALLTFFAFTQDYAKMIFTSHMRPLQLATTLSLTLLLAACQSAQHVPFNQQVTQHSNQPATQVGELKLLPVSGNSAHIYLLGEVHDNAAGHQARLGLFQQLVRQHQQQQKKLVLLLEQFDLEQQSQLQAAQARCRDVACLLQALDAAAMTSPSSTSPGATNSATKLATAAGLPKNKTLWHWPHYQALLQFALDHQIPLVAANLSRQSARLVMQNGYPAALSAAQIQRWQLSSDPANLSAAQRQDQAQDQAQGQRQSQPDGAPHQALLEAQQQQVLLAHCQQLPVAMAPAMARAQIARDLLMAELILQQRSSVVLVAGNGHIRKDWGVPYWLQYAARTSPAGSTMVPWQSIAFLEQAPDSPDYADLWQLIPVQPRPDPCAGFKPSNQQAKESA